MPKKQPDQAAQRRRARRDKLVETHAWIVAPIARHLAAQIPDSFELEDLIGAGNLALVAAADNYRPKEHGGAPFSAYARMRVRGAMIDTVRRRHYTRAKLTSSLDAPHYAAGEEYETAVDLLPAAGPDPAAHIDVDRAARRIRAALAQLPARHRSVLEQYYVHDRPMREIGDGLGVHRTRASQIHIEALALLRTTLGRP